VSDVKPPRVSGNIRGAAFIETTIRSIDACIADIVLAIIFYNLNYYKNKHKCI
jgi:hypothetical protein